MKNSEMNISIDNDRLVKYGENTSARVKTGGTVSGARAAAAAAAALKKLERLRDASGSEWLADNMYIVRSRTRSACERLRRAGKLRSMPGGVPVVTYAARCLARAGRGTADRRRIELYLDGFQKKNGLTEKELYLFVPALECALLEYLSEDAARAEAVFKTLDRIGSTELADALEERSVIGRRLMKDPAGVYPLMDKDSRAMYRRELARTAEKEGIDEEEAARRVVEKAAASGEKEHVGRYIMPGRRGRFRAYFTANALLALALTAAACVCARSAAAAPLVLLPAGEAAKYILDRIIAGTAEPKPLPRMDYSGGIPRESRTLCVTAALLTSPRAAAECAARLERYRLANRGAGSELVFGVLADLPEAESESLPSDAETVNAAAAEIRRLNGKYGGGFCLILRPRSFSERDGIYRGWERKRGAVIELTALLRGEKCSAEIAEGEKETLEGVSYLIVLDADTDLNIESAAKLAATMAHPMQKPVIRDGRRVSGCGIIQPEIGVSLAHAGRSDFAAVFAGQGGLDPYGGTAGDVYQELFGEASYIGKGIMSVDAVRACLAGRFPRDTLLSHDLIEGAYAGCAYAGDIELSDGFPSGLLSYYERQHRWIRGDWQTLPWLFGKVRDESGKKVKNPVSACTKFKIFDNLRRSVVPVSAFAALMLFALLGGRVFAAAAAAVLIFSAVKVIASSLRPSFARRKYRSSVLSGAAAELLQFFLTVLFLPYSAYVSAAAAAAALVRTFVTHRNMLQWVTAAQSESRRAGTVLSHYRRMAVCPLAGAVGLALTSSPPAAALCVLWLLAPAAARCMSREKKPNERVGDEERQFLLRCSADIWRFFDRMLTPRRHWLPPDNYQEPGHVTAERTSPTNVGLALLAALAADDLGLCTPERADELLGHMLDTLETLPKFRGNLYNWYDIVTLEPLKPEYVSTVDSGNLVCCLIVLARAERGELSRRAEKLAGEMRLDFLYDRDRRLFRIGWDPVGDAPSGGWYDLLESEARMTSYAAIARGEAEPRHWRRLGRIPAECGGTCGLASWTGTMFEYFMPALIMPYYRNSVLWESMALCYKAQRRRSRIWGISESAFARFDAAMNYSYKAHGVQSIALKRGMDRELVVSPYSTFIALPMGAKAAAANLRRLRAAGMEGEYGFYEALDLSEGTKRVKSFMAHHLAMSLVAADNALSDGIMRRRFMSDAEMGAYTELLEEKCPVGRPIRTERDYRAQEKPGRASPGGKRSAALTGVSLARPACRPLSNGRYTVLADELGCSRSTCGDILMTAYEPRRMTDSHGILFFLYSAKTLLPLQAAPDFSMNAEYSSVYADGRLKLFSSAPGWDSCVDTGVLPAGTDGELREVTVKNTSREKREAELIMYFEPVLTRESNYAAHPAFSKLRIAPGSENGCLTFTRRGDGREESFSLAVCPDREWSFDTDKCSALGRGGLRALPAALARPALNRLGGGPEPCALIRVPLTLRPGERTAVRFALCAAASPSAAAADAAKSVRKGARDESRFRSAAAKYDPAAALELLPSLVYQTQGKACAAKEKLWSFGISGDYPVMAARADERSAAKLLEAYGFLAEMGFRYDLAIMTDDAGEYGRPVCSAVAGLAGEMGLSGYLESEPGIRVIPCTEKQMRELAGSAAEPEYGRGATDVRAAVRYFFPADGENAAERECVMKDESFVSSTKKGIGDTAWSSVISFGGMGWIATDSLSGGMWLDNARENRLNRWLNDPLAVYGTERLELLRGGERISLCADADRYGCRTEFGFGWAAWEKNIDGTACRVTGFVPPDKNSRVLIIELDGARNGDRLSYFTQFEQSFGVSCSQTPETRYFDELEFITQGAARGGRPCFAAVYPPAEKTVISAGEAPGDIGEAYALLEKTKARWRGMLSAARIKTPCPELDGYINGWAMYQILSCRMFGRSSLYQSGGAFGFRDQLQDVCALADVMPELTKKHILLCAAHQYREGDVMHWWHPGEPDRGVRTRCSDDLLWLPYAAALYAEKTGDLGIFDQTVPWLCSPPLGEGEKDRYESAVGQGEASLREHCLKAMELAVRRGRGKHGLLYMGSGDWNDGFDGVGVKGESVWLSWFAAAVMKKWPEFSSFAEELGRAADRAFESGQYLRGYYENGAPLGAEGNRECAVDSLAQSFAELSGFGTRSGEALEKAVNVLYDGPGKPVRLFDPPFDGKEAPGYIRSYLPGVRENGGQYTHAAVWLAAALLRHGRTEEGWSVLRSLLPSDKPPRTYRAEPYVLAADVYTAEGMYGRAGWSWYTGAAGWYFRTVFEELLGIKFKNGAPSVSPSLPEAWESFEAEYAGWSFRGVKKDGEWECSAEKAGRPFGAPPPGPTDTTG